MAASSEAALEVLQHITKCAKRFDGVRGHEIVGGVGQDKTFQKACNLTVLCCWGRIMQDALSSRCGLDLPARHPTNTRKRVLQTACGILGSEFRMHKLLICRRHYYVLAAATAVKLSPATAEAPKSDRQTFRQKPAGSGRAEHDRVAAGRRAGPRSGGYGRAERGRPTRGELDLEAVPVERQ